MPTAEDITQQIKLLEIYRYTLTHYLRQQAIYGEVRVPPEVAYGIKEARENIRSIKYNLRSWGIMIDDLPSDSDEPNINTMSDITADFTNEPDTMTSTLHVKGLDTNRTGINVFCEAELAPLVKAECIVVSNDGSFKTNLQSRIIKFIELQPDKNYKIIVRIPQLLMDVRFMDARAEIGCILRKGERQTYSYRPGWTAIIKGKIDRIE